MNVACLVSCENWEWTAILWRMLLLALAVQTQPLSAGNMVCVQAVLGSW
jgi:hypothetical protein